MAVERKPGGRYVQNRVTGAVFHYNDRIVDLADMQEMIANDEGVLVKVESRKPPDPQLAPTKTPEKKETTPAAADKPGTSAPTLAPADDK